MRSLRARGYANTFGYDVGDGRNLLGDDRDHISVGSLLDLKLPYEDNTFDLVTSDQVFEHVQDQVRVFQELCADHQARRSRLARDSARYMPIEGHIFVPFGGVSSIAGGTSCGLYWNPQQAPGRASADEAPITTRSSSLMRRATLRLPAIA